MVYYRITGPKFVAALSVHRGVIHTCAPILTKVCRRFDFDWKRVAKHAKEVGWEVEEV